MANKWRKRALAAEKARADDYLDTAVHEAEHNGLVEMARNLLAENSRLWDDWTAEHALAVKLKRKLDKLRGLHRDETWGHEVTATTCDTALEDLEALLAWQSRVREKWAAYDAEFEVDAATLSDLRQAIESDELKEER